MVNASVMTLATCKLHRYFHTVEVYSIHDQGSTIIPAGLIRLAKHGFEYKIKGQGHSRFNGSPEVIAAYNASLNCTYALRTHRAP